MHISGSAGWHMRTTRRMFVALRLFSRFPCLLFEEAGGTLVLAALAALADMVPGSLPGCREDQGVECFGHGLILGPGEAAQGEDGFAFFALQKLYI